jgi:hypothetical protein
MATRDLASHIAVRESIRAAVHNSTVTGQTVDTRGFASAAAVVTVGAVAGSGNITVKLQDSANGSDWADVVAADLIGSFPAALVQNTSFRVGYIGAQRYLRAVGTLNSGTSVAFAAPIVLGDPEQRPTS